MGEVNWEGLRKPFPKTQITKVDKGFGPIDTINHAVVTSRLIDTAGDWTFTIDDTFRENGSFWVRGTLTIGGIERSEFGEGKDPKKALSDFIKRAAMRFGCGLDLWAKAPLDDYETSSDARGETTAGTGADETILGTGVEALGEGVSTPGPKITAATLALLKQVYGSNAKILKAAHERYPGVLSIADLDNDQALGLMEGME